MVLNYIWFAFFAIAFVIALCRLVFLNDTTVFPELMNATFEMAKKGFEVSIGLAGALTLWLGLMRIGEHAGLINVLARAVSPFFRRIFPDIPKDHPALGFILLNFSANMLGLDNAASPLGLNAMQSLQELNPKKDTASNSMIMFLVINTAGLTIIPVSVMAFRAQAGAHNPADIFIPSIIGTGISALSGLLIVAIWQKLNLFKPVVYGSILAFAGALAGMLWYFHFLPEEKIATVSAVVSSVVLLSVIMLFLTAGMIKKVNVYDSFIQGAKDGFVTAVKIIPYAVAMLVGIGVFRASGGLGMITDGIAWLAIHAGLDTAFIPALPTGLMKPFSGPGARGLMIETMKLYGADSFAGKAVCVIQGSTDTTFYTIGLYYGSIGVKKIRYTAGAGIIVDMIGIAAAIWLAYLFF
ncbi:MAG: nucleoside recognition domain-containing protein [Bacteroidota bacterium]